MTDETAHFRPLPGTHDNVYDRSGARPEYDRAWFGEGDFVQAADLNEAFSRQDLKRTRIANMVAADGDRIEGCDIRAADPSGTDSSGTDSSGTETPGTFHLSAGRVYVRGDVREVGAATLTGVALEGDVQIGVRILEETITHENDPDLLGLHPGTAAHGEPGALRTRTTLSWGWSGDTEPGALYAVYALRDGQVIDQTPPPELSGVAELLAAQDYGAHENYIDEGCEVTALGRVSGQDGDEQVFSIAEGAANILGFKRTRFTATRFAEPERPDIETVDAEPYIYAPDGASGAAARRATIGVNHTPVNGVATLVIEKEFTETIVRGVPGGSSDLLSRTGVIRVIRVRQNRRTYAETTDWTLNDDRIDWSAGGAEPAGGSSYRVTYRYYDAVEPDAVSDTGLTVSGGVEGGAVIVSYSFKLPRIDRLCLDGDGNVVYLKGLSARELPQAPLTPRHLLALADIHNDWVATPRVVNNGVRNMPFRDIWRMYNRLVDALDLISLERLRRDISAREPTAKHAVFVDPFTSDRYRDEGVEQDAALVEGRLTLAIDPAFGTFHLATPAILDHDPETVIAQELVTGCMRINPYQVFQPLPLTLTMTPDEDFWEESNVNWLSGITNVFENSSRSGTFTRTIESISQRRAVFLRQITINFEIGELGEGERIGAMTFDGIDVNPGNITGNAQGRASGSFVIPANVTAGVKEFRVTAASGRGASARFEGRGTITDITRQRITDIHRSPPPPPPPPPRRERVRDDRIRRDADPLAQTFRLPAGRHVAGVDVQFCALGDTSNPVICEIVEVENGIPTTNVIAQAQTDAATVTIGTWHRFTFALPVFIAAGREHAFVFKTDDGEHSLSIASRGGFDAALQRHVGAQPYTVGVLLSSSNARTWTAHQDDDLAMRVLAARFAPTEKTVVLGTMAVEDMSDLVIAANVDLPTDDASVLFRVTPEGETPRFMEAGQNWRRTSFFTGDVAVEAILRGSWAVSPILGRSVMAVAGSLRTSGTYVSRAFSMGRNVRQDVRLKTHAPAGSDIAVEIDKGDGDWQALEEGAAEVLPDGTHDRQYTKARWTARLGRVRITLTGTPAARPNAADLRSYSV